MKPSKTPGPGTYNPRSGLSTSVPKYSFRPRIKSKYSSNKFTPGPGSYNPKNLSRTLKYSMGSRIGNDSTKARSEGVGPGTYQLPDIISKPRSKVVFSKGKRFGVDKSLHGVGPGTYDLPDTKSKIAYSMGPKNKSLILNSNPGPGHYNPKNSLVFPRCVLSVFDKGSRGKENKWKRDVLGPGSYNPKLLAKDLGYSFGKGRRMKSLKQFKDIPGPGTYEIKSFLENYPAYALWSGK